MVPATPMVASLAVVLVLATLPFPGALAQTSAGFADLTVVRLVVDPPAPGHGGPVTFAALVRNDGGAMAAATTTRFLIDGTIVSDVATPAIGPGAEASVAARVGMAQAGPHTVAATADALAQVAETDEGDNTLAQAFDVTPSPGPPDLLAERLTIAPISVFAGDAAQVIARVRNGGTDAAAGFVVTFLVDGLAIGSRTVDGLAGDTAVRVISPGFEATEGARVARVVVDPTQLVLEQNEANNEALVNFQVPASAPDLVVEAVEAQPAAPTAGAGVTFVARVRNAGGFAAGPFDVAFRIDGEPMGSAAIAALPAGATVQARSPAWVALAGAQRMEAIADPDDRVREENEANNVATLPMPTLGALANLVVGAVATNPRQAKAGEPTTLTATVTNTGSAPSTRTRVAFLLDGAAVGNPMVLEVLQPGASATVASEAFLLTSGTHGGLARADPADTVAEEREDDNTATLRIEAVSAGAATAGAVVASIATDPVQPIAGETATTAVVVRNTGTAAVAGLVVELRSDGALVGSRALGTLAAGASERVAFAWTPEAGDHTVSAALVKDGAPAGEAASQQVHVEGALVGISTPVIVLLLLMALIVVAVLVITQRRRHI